LLRSDMTVKEILDKYPALVDVFIKQKLLCIGCPTEAFHTIEDVARIHNYPLKELMGILTEAIQEAEN